MKDTASLGTSLVNEALARYGGGDVEEALSRMVTWQSWNVVYCSFVAFCLSRELSHDLVLSPSCCHHFAFRSSATS